MNNNIQVTHENGYTGILYGKQSLVVLKDNEEVMHTGFRNKNLKTSQDLYDFLDKFPRLLEILKEVDNEEEGEDF